MTPETVLRSLVARSYWADVGATLNTTEHVNRFDLREYLIDLVGEDQIELPPSDQRVKPRPLPPIRTVGGTTSTKSKAARETLEEVAADALKGMAMRSMDAILVALGADDDALERTRTRLHREVKIGKEKRPQEWPKVRRARFPSGHHPCEDYSLDMVELAMIELRVPTAFRAVHQRAEWLGVSERTFYRHLKKAHDHLQSELFTWYLVGESHIGGRLAARRKRLES